ncbi:MAG: hypothetical protein ACI84R_000881 [Candidatus Azotimanducaceae bacterium]|jgi:hypothetical protein
MVCGTVAAADDLSARHNCDLLIRLLPDDLNNLPILSCQNSILSQVTTTVELNVPAERVPAIEDVLIDTFNMEPLNFVCCGFETQPINLVLPKDHQLRNDTPTGAYRSVVLSFFATAQFDDTNEKFIKLLGHADAKLTLKLIDH